MLFLCSHRLSQPSSLYSVCIFLTCSSLLLYKREVLYLTRMFLVKARKEKFHDGIVNKQQHVSSWCFFSFSNIKRWNFLFIDLNFFFAIFRVKFILHLICLKMLILLLINSPLPLTLGQLLGEEGPSSPKFLPKIYLRYIGFPAAWERSLSNSNTHLVSLYLYWPIKGWNIFFRSLIEFSGSFEESGWLIK